MSINLKIKATMLVALILTVLLVQPHQGAQSVLSQAATEYSSKHFAESARLYIKAIDNGNSSPATFYNAACSLALAGKKSDAIVYLKSAVDGGFGPSSAILADTDLVSLHDAPEWQQIVTSAKASEARAMSIWDSPALATPYRENISMDEKIAGLSRAWSEARAGFVNFDLVPDLDWDSLYLKTLPEVEATHSTLDYYLVLAKFYAALKDGHTNIIYPPELRPKLFAAPDIATRLVGGKVLVIGVGSDAKTAGVSVGDELLEVDSIPVHRYAESKIQPYQASSTPQWLDSQTYESWLLKGAEDTKLALTLAHPNGTRYEATLFRLFGERRKEKLPARPLTELKILPQGIAYFRIDSFNDPALAQQFVDQFDQIKAAKGLIIDIRDNGGGNSSNTWKILGCLTDAPYPNFAWRARQYRAVARAGGNPEIPFVASSEMIAPDGARLFKGPVAVLISSRTFSAAEDFCVSFVGMHRGILVGEPTGGSTGQPVLFSLPGGGKARFCARHAQMADGSEFVGKGIKPDIPSPQTVADIRNGHDSTLDAAINGLWDKTHQRLR